MNYQNNALLDKIFPFLKIGHKKENSVSRFYYKTRLNRISTWDKLGNLIIKGTETNLETKCAVQFRDIPFGLGRREIVELLGKPRFEMKDNISIKGHAVYFYKFDIEGISAKSEIHFINNYFFMATNTFPCIYNGHNPEIEEVVATKYIGDPTFSFDKILHLKDFNNNLLIIQSDVEFNLTYVTGNSNFHEQVFKKLGLLKSQQSNIENRRTEILLKML